MKNWRLVLLVTLLAACVVDADPTKPALPTATTTTEGTIAPSAPVPSITPPASAPVLPTEPAPQSDSFLSGIQNSLPNDWTLTVITETGKMGHPHGLEEPVFRIDFTDQTRTFITSATELHPYLRLYFYRINDKEKILGIIQQESIYSWDIPTYFAETKEYIIVTSPLYINHGIYTEEAIALFTPLEQALKDYFAACTPTPMQHTSSMGVVESDWHIQQIPVAFQGEWRLQNPDGSPLPDDYKNLVFRLAQLPTDCRILRVENGTLKEAGTMWFASLEGATLKVDFVGQFHLTMGLEIQQKNGQIQGTFNHAGSGAAFYSGAVTLIPYNR